MTETGLLSIIVIALGLSADCFAVALSSSISRKTVPIRLVFKLALSFGIFQAAMTLLGWLAGNTVIDYISDYDHWLAFGLLAFVGGRMIWESLRSKGHGENKRDITIWWVIILLSIATSLDALAVGLSFAFLSVDIKRAVLIIGLVAFSITIIGILLGKRLGALMGKKAEVIGGIILIVIGVRILIEHLVL